MLPLLTVRLSPLHYNPTIAVGFSMYGSSARVVEMEVTSKLEGLLARMKGVRGINSKSYNGGGNIWVYLDKHSNIESLRLEASSIIRQAWPDLPDGTSYGDQPLRIRYRRYGFGLSGQYAARGRGTLRLQPTCKCRL